MTAALSEDLKALLDTPVFVTVATIRSGGRSPLTTWCTIASGLPTPCDSASGVVVGQRRVASLLRLGFEAA